MVFAEQLSQVLPAELAAYDPKDGISLAEGELIALVYNPDLRYLSGPMAAPVEDNPNPNSPSAQPAEEVSP